MSYQQPPDRQTNTPAEAPAGWYPDPGGLQALRWWDGAQWSSHTQALPVVQEYQLSYPGAVESASSRYGTFWQGRGGERRQQPDPYQPQGPQQRADQQPDPEPPQQSSSNGYPPDPSAQQSPHGAYPTSHGGRHGNPRRRHRIGLAVLIGGGALILIIASGAVAVAALGTHKPHASASPSDGPLQACLQLHDFKLHNKGQGISKTFGHQLEVEAQGTQLGTDIDQWLQDLTAANDTTSGTVIQWARSNLNWLAAGLVWAGVVVLGLVGAAERRS
jgi:hypothetical protein